METKEYDKACPYLLKSVEKGFVDAMGLVGCLYASGEGVERDFVSVKILA